MNPLIDGPENCAVAIRSFHPATAFEFCIKERGHDGPHETHRGVTFDDSAAAAIEQIAKDLGE